MMEQSVNPDFVADWEDVARLLFSPLFICEGVLSQRAFMLESSTGETYISVLRLSMECFESDMEGIKREGNVLYGYAQMNVGCIRNASVKIMIITEIRNTAAGPAANPPEKRNRET